jgi:hypothetical protein
MESRGRGGEAAGEVTRADFPEGFVFGVATSAYQVSYFAVLVVYYLHLGRRRLLIPAPTPAKSMRVVCTAFVACLLGDLGYHVR